MYNEDLTRLARWVIPGWIVLFSFYIFVFADSIVHSAISTSGESAVSCHPLSPPLCKRGKLASKDSRPCLNTIHCPLGYYPINCTLLDVLYAWFQETPLNEGLLAAFIAVSGVPLGFLVYQSYFFLRWNTPHSGLGFMRLLPGRMADLHRVLLNLSKENLSLNEEWRWEILKNPLFGRDHRFTWRYVENFFLETIHGADNKMLVYQRYRYLHQIVHVLGASLAAVFLGFVGYLFFKYVQHIRLLLYRSGFTLIKFAGFLLFVIVFHFFLAFLQKKENWIRDYVYGRRLEDALRIKQEDLLQALDDPLPGIYVSALGQKIYFPYPSLFLLFLLILFNAVHNPVLQLQPRGGVLFVMWLFFLTLSLVILWGMPGGAHRSNIDQSENIPSAIFRKPQPHIRTIPVIIYYSLASVVVFSGLFIRCFSIPWGMFTSFSVLMVIYYLLIQNRQNAREEMLDLQHYIIRDFLYSKGFLEKEASA